MTTRRSPWAPGPAPQPPRPAVRSLPWLLAALAGCGDNLTHPDGPQPYQPVDAAPLACVPDLDGRISADELVAAVGVPASFLITPAGAERAVDVAGEVDGSGHRVWDWSAAAADDVALEVAARSLTGAWYASSFPGGELAVSLDAGGATDAVYATDEQGLWLLGMASREADPPEGRTLLVYGAPVATLRFPLEPGVSWVSVGAVTGGTFRGLPYAGRDTYEVEVDAAGRLVLPDLEFTQVHRVRTRVTVEPSVGASTSRRQVSFFFECFGEVARATSRADEPAEDFTTAAEVRRMGL